MISVSFLGIHENVKEELKKLDEMNISFFHCDIMDGKFVSNKTWDYKSLQPIVTNLTHPLDVHLMVEDVESYIESFSKLNPHFLTFHIEATNEPEKMISKIHALGCKAGISVKPNTPISSIIPYLDQVDLVLVMSVEPGKGGQAFLSSSLEKIKELKKIQPQYHYVIEVDGGVNDETISRCQENGADLFVVGSFITKEYNYQKQITLLHSKIDKPFKK